MATATTSEAQSEQSNAKPGLRKPVFIKVDQLKPGTSGHTLVVKVLSSNTVLQKGRSVSHHLRQTRIAECLISDETGTIVFTARNDQGTFLPSPIVFSFRFPFFLVAFLIGFDYFLLMVKKDKLFVFICYFSIKKKKWIFGWNCRIFEVLLLFFRFGIGWFCFYFVLRCWNCEFCLQMNAFWIDLFSLKHWEDMSELFAM